MEKEKQKKLLPPKFIRGGVYIADLGVDAKTGEQIGKRPVVVIQNDKANKIKPTLVVATVTTTFPKKLHPVHIKLTPEKYKRISVDSVVQLDQIKTISKDRINIPLPLEVLTKEDMKLIDSGILYSLGISI